MSRGDVGCAQVEAAAATLRYLSYKESRRGALSSNGNNIVVKWVQGGSLRAAPKKTEQENEWWAQAYAVLR